MIDFNLFQKMLESYKADEAEAHQDLSKRYEALYSKVKDLHLDSFCLFAHLNERVKIDFYITENADLTFYQTLYMTKSALAKLYDQYPNDVVMPDFSLKCFLREDLTYGQDYVFENYDIHCAYVYKQHTFAVCFTKNRVRLGW